MEKTNYKIAGAVLTLCLIMLSVGIAFGTQIATTNYFLDTPLPIADYYIGQYSNSSYFVVNGSTWDNFAVSTNASYIINTCTQTANSHIIISGTFTITNTILVNADNVTLQGAGTANTKLVLGASADVNLINVTGHYVTIKDMMLDGYRSGNTAGIGIYQKNAYNNRYENLDIRYCDGDGLMIEAIGTYGNNWVTNCKIVDCDENGINLYLTCDDFITGNDVGGMGDDVIRVTSSAAETINDNKIYMGDYGIKAYDCNILLISGNTIRANQYHGISLNYVENSTISNNFCSLNDQSISGDAGIIVDNSKYLSITGGLTGNYESGVAFTQSYGIRLLSGVNYTSVVGVIANLNSILNISVDNTSSTIFVGSCMNGTSWVN